MSFLFGKEKQKKEPLIVKDVVVDDNVLPSGDHAAMVVRQMIKKRKESEQLKDAEAKEYARDLLDFLLKDKFEELCQSFRDETPNQLHYLLNGDKYMVYKPYVNRIAFEREILDVLKSLGYIDCKIEKGMYHMNIAITIPGI